MTPPGRANPWDSAPVALLRLNGAGAILDVNDRFRGWFDDDTALDLRGTRLSTLLSAGGRIYWETHLAPLLRMQGRVEEIAVELRTGGIRRPVLLSAELHGAGDDVLIEVALFDARERSRFERELVAARAEAERSAASVRTLLVTTTALAQAAGVEGVCKALVHTAVGEFRAESASVWLVDDSGRSPSARSWASAHPPRRRPRRSWQRPDLPKQVWRRPVPPTGAAPPPGRRRG